MDKSNKHWSIWKEDNSYYELVIAILKYAYNDAIAEIEKLKKGKIESIDELDDILKFFTSKYYKEISSVDNTLFLEQITIEINKTMEILKQGDVYDKLNNMKKKYKLEN